jgi:8-oxoguanine deaminase
MPTLLAKNASVLVTMDEERRELKNGGLFARDGIIEQVGPTDQLPATADQVLELSGQIVLPGFVNTHHHLGQTLTRNLPAAQNNNLFPWLRAHYGIWARRRPAATRGSTLVGLAELFAARNTWDMKTGTGTSKTETLYAAWCALFELLRRQGKSTY